MKNKKMPANSKPKKLFDDDAEDAEVKSFNLKVRESTVPKSSFSVRVLDGNASHTSFLPLHDFGVSEQTIYRLRKLKFTEMTEFQSKAVPALLEGRDLIATSNPKAGKVVAYLVPGIKILSKLRFIPRYGTGLLILLPTEEAIREIYNLVQFISKPHKFTCCHIMSGNSKEEEVHKLREGMNLVVATPGHLLHHMNNTDVFKYKNLQYLVIDEADRYDQLGLNYELKQILELLPKRRQTVVLSDNFDKATENLAELALKKLPFYTSDHEVKSFDFTGKVVEYATFPSEERFSFLFTFLRSNRNKKIVVTLSSAMSAQFHFDIFDYLKVACFCVHGEQDLILRSEIFFEFSIAQHGVLFCSNAAARMLDVLNVDWIVHQDPPDYLYDFINKHGRVIDGSPAANVLLVLRPEECGFVSYLEQAKVQTRKNKVSSSSLLHVQKEVESAVMDQYFLYKTSHDAYMAYIKAYAAHSLNSIFDVNSLDLVKVATSFGFSVPPYVDFDVHCRQAGKKSKRKIAKSRKVQAVLQPVKIKRSNRKRNFVS